MQASSFLGKVDSQTLIGSASLPRVSVWGRFLTTTSLGSHLHSVGPSVNASECVSSVQVRARCGLGLTIPACRQVRELRTAQSSSPLDPLQQTFAGAKAQVTTTCICLQCVLLSLLPEMMPCCNGL